MQDIDSDYLLNDVYLMVRCALTQIRSTSQIRPLEHFVSRIVRPIGLLAAIFTLAAPGGSLAQSAGAVPDGMSPQVFQQIQAIANDKAQRTPAQRKLGSDLIYAARAANGLPAVQGADALQLPPLYDRNIVDAGGSVLVDISTTDADALAGPIQQLGGSVMSSFPQYNFVRAKLPVTVLEALAANPSVRSIRTALLPMNNRVVAPPRAPFAARAAIVRAQLRKALGVGTNPGAQTQVGKGTTISEAVVAHGADIVQNAGITGAGVKLCVLSDGIKTLAARQAAGELPAVQVLSGQAGPTTGDEGTAMLELVADMAPGASLGFATAYDTKLQFAQNILDLRNVMGCNIIVDDVSYYDEGAFQEDVVANAVTTVVNSGALYFSSAANSGHLSGGQSGTWEGDFVNGGAPTGLLVNSGTVHSFGTALYNTLTSSTPYISLKWSDPIAHATNDYDLYVLNSAGTVVIGAGATDQNGTQDPFEIASCSSGCTSGNFPSGSRIYIIQFAGSARALRLDTNRGRLSIGTNGSTYGHNGGINTISVGAVSNNFTPIRGRKFAATDTITTYSSDGPRKLFLNPVPATTYITTGCATYGCTGGGGTLLPKVDIAAADCDSNTTPGFTPYFCGTSAAAPQAAAIAALIKSSSLGLSNANILARMKSTAIDIMAAGSDVDSGAGIVMADAALMNALTITSTPSGRSFSVSGTNCAAGSYTTPATLTIPRGTTCNFSTTATQPGAAGTQYVFTSWSDNGSTSNPRAIVVPDATATSIDLVFTTQYQLTTAAAPAGAGTVAPTSGTYFNAGTAASLAATSNSGYQFGSWTGSVAAATSASTTVTMSSPQSVTANFLGTTTTSITASPNPGTAGQPVTLSATVSSAAGTPTGTVSFRDGATTIATVSLSGNTASTAAGPAGGTHSFTAVYNGDGSFAGSTSATIVETVNFVASTTTLASGTNPSNQGHSVTFVATVTGTGATGTVSFNEGTATLGSAPLSAGTASFTTASLSDGPHVISANYSGDTTFSPSTSTTISQVVHTPCSDAFASAPAFASANGAAFGTTIGTTGETGEPNHAGNSTPLNSVWCKWTPAASGIVTFDTTGSNFDTTLAVYTGGVISTLTQVAANDNIASGNPQSRVSFAATAGTAYMIAVDGAGAATGNYVLNWALADPATTVTYASILPSARSVTTGTVATAFATIINAGSSTATACSLAAPPGFPAAFSYQITDANNVPTGTANTPKDIAAGASQSFVFAVTPLVDLNAVDLAVVFACTNTPTTVTVSGLNTLLLSASSTPSPDMVAIGATPTNDGILNIPGNGGTVAFAAAAIDIGAAGSITATVDDNGKGLALTSTLCQSDSTTAACVNPPAPGAAATLTVNTNDVVTFTIFVTGTGAGVGAVSFDPANNRLFLRLKTPDGVTRGATSVAVRTQ